MQVARSEVTTWLDKVASMVGFDRVAAVLPIDISPSMLAVGVGLGIDMFVLQPYQYLVGQTPTISKNPFYILIPITILLTVYVTRSLHLRYQQTLREMQIETRTSDYSQFETLVPDWVRWGFFLLFVTVTLVNMVVFITVSQMLDDGGIALVFGNLVLVPFVNVPVATDAIATYLGIQLVLPRQIEQSDLQLDFLDPEGLGGLRPVGELIKHSYYYTAAAIIGFAVYIYGPTLFDPVNWGFTPTEVTNALFTVAWVGAAAVLCYALYVFHRFMRAQKRAKLFELDQEFRSLVDGPWEITDHQIPEEKEEQVAQIREQMNQITTTREYPATFAMWSQIIIGLVLPKAVQFVLNSV